MTDLTKQESSNGWDAQSLEAYRIERDKAAAVVPGNVVTSYKRGRDPVRVEGLKFYNPFHR